MYSHLSSDFILQKAKHKPLFIICADTTRSSQDSNPGVFLPRGASCYVSQTHLRINRVNSLTDLKTWLVKGSLADQNVQQPEDTVSL